MAKYKMEIEVRETYKKEIEADSLEEAKAKAKRVEAQTNTYHTPQLDLVDDNPTYEHVDETVTLLKVTEESTNNSVIVDNTAHQLIERIDWTKLSEQKDILVRMIQGWGEADDDTQKEEGKIAGGLLSLLDTIQDHAVDVMGVKENIVFPNLKDV